MTLVFFWIAFCIVVGVAANARGRNGFGWFALALLISPLIALLLVLVMERRNVEKRTPDFQPESVHEGIPYRIAQDGSVEAIMQGARVRFADYGKFSLATGAPALPESVGNSQQPPASDNNNPWLLAAFLLFVTLIAAFFLTR